MRKQLRYKISSRYNAAAEDLRILQQMVTKQSVYAKARLRQYERRPKHRNRYMEYIEIA